MRGGMFLFNCIIAFAAICGVVGSLIVSLGQMSEGGEPVFGITVALMFILLYAILNIFGLDD